MPVPASLGRGLWQDKGPQFMAGDLLSHPPAEGDLVRWSGVGYLLLKEAGDMLERVKF